MLISICMPTLGRHRYVRSALHSILLQEFDDIELVVRDGDPADPIVSDPQVKALLELMPRLAYQAGPNLGLFGGFNDCLRRARGDVLYCMGSDDLLAPGALKAVNQEFEHERYPTTFWLYGRTVSITEEGRQTGQDPKNAINLLKMLYNNSIGLPSVFWARGLYGLEGGFDRRYRHAADYDMWLRLWRRREPLFLDQELGVYRHHQGQACRVYADDLEDEAKRVGLRHRSMQDIIQSARNQVMARRQYPDKILPESVN